MSDCTVLMSGQSQGLEAMVDPGSRGQRPLPDVDLVRPRDPLDEIAATWLYGVTRAPFRVIGPRLLRY